jgi:hypothetical protein
LADENELPGKAHTLLRPGSSSFDLSLEDFIAEMLAAQYLSTLGHTDIRFPPDGGVITTDLVSIKEGVTYVTEAKNLREPNSLAYVAFRRWHHNRAANPAAFNFTAEILEIEDPFEDLTVEQANGVRNLIDALTERPRPSTFEAALPGGRVVRIRVWDGAPGLVQHGPGPFLVAPVLEESQRAIIVKLLEPARKALTQLYSTSVPDSYRRLLFFRWKPPDEVLAIGEANGIRAVIQEKCQAFFREFFPSFALVVLQTGEQMEDVPRSTWL